MRWWPGSSTAKSQCVFAGAKGTWRGGACAAPLILANYNVICIGSQEAEAVHQPWDGRSPPGEVIGHHWGLLAASMVEQFKRDSAACFSRCRRRTPCGDVRAATPNGARVAEEGERLAAELIIEMVWPTVWPGAAIACTPGRNFLSVLVETIRLDGHQVLRA